MINYDVDKIWKCYQLTVYNLQYVFRLRVILNQQLTADVYKIIVFRLNSSIFACVDFVEKLLKLKHDFTHLSLDLSTNCCNPKKGFFQIFELS